MGGRKLPADALAPRRAGAGGAKRGGAATTARRNDDDAVSAARARFLARKAAAQTKG